MKKEQKLNEIDERLREATEKLNRLEDELRHISEDMLGVLIEKNTDQE